MKTYEIIVRIGLAIIIGGIIGYEREAHNRPAGFRTHILVCMGAVVVSMIQIYCIEQVDTILLIKPELTNILKVDIGRLGAQVITGVGFLGAGTILHEKGSVKGLTTAASIWVVACIGLAIGFGLYFLSLISSFGVIMVLYLLKRVEKNFIDNKRTIMINIKYEKHDDMIKKNVEKHLEKNNIKVKSIQELKQDENDKYSCNIYTVIIPKHITVSQLINYLRKIDSVKEVEEIK
ncbi:MgtC/SapB family protein [Haloimpatiens sp. FM7330]|uniref:MgtC/SapB family protein n=1 Tax=Haloimpatiens sp. FM7330 TaxID=3298610 RepID=UPI00362BACF3